MKTISIPKKLREDITDKLFDLLVAVRHLKVGQDVRVKFDDKDIILTRTR